MKKLQPTANGFPSYHLKKSLSILSFFLSGILFTLSAISQNTTISGRVTNETGQPLRGVSVFIKGTPTGITTNSNGEFTLSAPANGTLTVSYVGYTTQEVPINNQTSLNITLLPAAGTQLEQVVVVGYGTQRKIDVTGSVSQLKGEEISKQSVVNPISGLQGKVAGVQITNNGGPGSSPEIRIRGLGTVYGNPNPLYVVDGVWYDDISFLNPNDIESISILKDASSESIYGIRAANGVVLITTKKGRSGQAVINYNGYVGFQSVTNEVEMANAKQYATLINEKTGSQLLDSSNFGEGTNWYNVALRNAFTTSHQVSVSGGSERSTYNFSLGYLDQQGIVKTNDYKRFTARLQNDFQLFKDLKLGYTVIGTSSNSDDINGGIFHQLFAAAPVVPVYYADGSYGDPADYALGNTIANPQATIDFYNHKSKNNIATGNIYADLKILRHFTFHTSFGGEYAENEVKGYNPVYNATSNQQNSISVLTVSRAETRNWLIENTLTYTNRFNDHNITVLAGQSAQHYQSYSITGSAQNVPNSSSGDLYLKLGSTTGSNVTDAGDISNIASYFGRVNYAFKNRYLLNASIRADGSSKFFGDQRWGYFPSIGVGWVISDESFMQNQKIFNTLKLRGSWGKIGNASVPSNISVLRVAQDPYLTAIFGGQPYTGASINTIVPPTTYWERGVGTDIGLEIALLKRKLSIEADYYIKKTEQAIFAIPVLGSLGTSSSTIIANQATFQNQGYELTATWRDNVNNDLSYNISGNISINDNKVLSVVTGNNPIYAGGAGATSGQLVTRTVAGQPIGEFYGLQVVGIFQTQADIDASPQKGNAKPGDFIYADRNKDGVIDGRDRVVLGNPNPKYTYGLNTNWTYKDFDLTLDFQGVAGVDIYNANQALRYGNENYTEDFYNNRWHGAGTSNSYPSANIGGNQNYLPNSWFVESGNYFRIRNMQLGYTLPTSLVSRWHMERLRIYVNAQNAFNFFSYKGFSPEVGGTPTNAGIDTNVYPLYATYNFGINLTL